MVAGSPRRSFRHNFAIIEHSNDIPARHDEFMTGSTRVAVSRSAPSATAPCRARCCAICRRAQRMRPRLLAEHRRVSGEAAILAPYMELIAGRTRDPETAAFELDVGLA